MYKELGRKSGIARTNSICPTPESVLLDLVLENQREYIERMVKSNRKLLEFIYTPEYNKPILLIACSEDSVEPETVKTLINLGANLRYSQDTDEYWEAIHFAAWKIKSDLLKVIVDGLKDKTAVNSLAKGSNALHILIRYCEDGNSKEVAKCVKILIDAGIDVNQSDDNLVSPILWAAKKKNIAALTAILQYSLVPVDLDTHYSRGKTARNLIENHGLFDGALPKPVDNNNKDDKDILFKYIYSGNDNAFVNYKNGDIYDLVNNENKSGTLLQVACEKRRTKIVKCLVEKGANPNKLNESNRKPSIEIAADNGDFEIFSILVSHPKIHLPKGLMINLLKFIDNDSIALDSGISYEKCFEILLERLRANKDLLDVNECDKLKYSPLHYALRYAKRKHVNELLDLGASLGSKNKYNVMPIQDIEPEFLEQHLNKCVQFDLNGKKFDKEDFIVTFNYRTLIPPIKKTEFDVSFENSDLETNLYHTSNQKLVAETEVISYMSETPEFKHLLKHPVIVSFLFMKWYRIRWLFYTNYFFYMTFFASLVLYIFTYYLNPHASYTQFQKFGVGVLWIILLVTFFVLILRELFQMSVSPTKYFKNFENYIELLLVVLVGIILFLNTNWSREQTRPLASLSILLAAFELVLMMGQHPKLSTNVVMLKTVSFNFFKFLLWYSLLIVAFALSFYILFTDADAENAKNKTVKNISSTFEEGEEQDSFRDPGKSFFKTIVMLTGEFDAGSINFQRFPIVSQVIFSLFIFMIAIILLNLLNGLAVSDTQMIKNDAELVSYIARAQHISYVESMLMGNVLPSNILSSLKKIFCCFPNGNETYFLKPLVKNVCLFPHYLNYELTIYPNKYGQISLPNQTEKQWFGKFCLNYGFLYLDKETIKRTQSIVQTKQNQLKADLEDDNIKKLEKSLQILSKNMEKDKLELLMLNKKLDYVIKCLQGKFEE